MDRENVVYIYSGILVSHKKHKIMPFAATWNGPRDYHTKWSKSDKDKYDITYMQNLIFKMKQMNLFTKQKQTHRSWNQTYGYQRGNMGGNDKLGVCD